MNKLYDCDLIQDLLPLYQDEICSESSKKAVQEHLEECTVCRNTADKLMNDRIEKLLIQEKNKVLVAHKKKERKRTFTIGIVTASVLMIPIIVCLICNLAIGHALDWFFIVLAAMLVVASLTVVPLVVQSNRGVWTIVGFTGSLLTLLLVCCSYVGGNWFVLVAVSCMLGLSIVLAPYVIHHIPLPKFLRNQKGLLVMVWDTLWLFALITVCGIYVGGSSNYWHIAIGSTIYGIALPWIIFVIIRYFPVHTCTKIGLITMIVGIYSAFANDALTWLSGYQMGGSILKADLLSDFSTKNREVLNANILLIVMIALIFVGAIFVVVGLATKKRAGRS